MVGSLLVQLAEAAVTNETHLRGQPFQHIASVLNRGLHGLLNSAAAEAPAQLLS